MMRHTFSVVTLVALCWSSVALAQTTAPAAPPVQTGASTSRADSFIFFTDKAAKDYRQDLTKRRRDFGPTAPEFNFQVDDKAPGVRTPIYQREIGRWKDPLTLPHTRTECVQYASGDIPFDGKWKTCSGWKTQFQWLFVTAWIRIQTSKEEDIGKALDECFTDAAVAGAVAGIITGGSAALETFGVVLKGCLIAKLPDLVNVAAYETTEWGDWE